MGFQPDPNITEQTREALKKVCPFCGAKPGKPCWSLRSTKANFTEIPEERTRPPHKQRIKASWAENYTRKVA